MKAPASPYRTETAWQSDVVTTATRFGWVAWHHHDSRRTRAGLPDLELLHPRGFSARVELKADDLTKSRLSPEQVVTLDLLEHCGSECAVWRPGDRAAIDDWLVRPHKQMPGLWAVHVFPYRRLREIRLLQPAELTRLVVEVGPAHGVTYGRRDDTFTPGFHA